MPVLDPEERSRGHGLWGGGWFTAPAPSHPFFHLGEPVSLGQNSHFLPLSNPLPSAQSLTTSDTSRTPAYHGDQSAASL